MSRLLAVTVLLQGILMACGSPTIVKPDYQLDTRQSCTTPRFASSWTDLSDFNDQMKEWHDYFRCHHGSGSVTIDSELTAFAQTWAETLANTNGDPASWHSAGRYDGNSATWRGENVFAGFWEAKIPAWYAVRGTVYFGFKDDGSYRSGWYCGEYNVYKNSQDKKADLLNFGHFSQVVWKDSVNIGCGTAKGNGRTYIVCQYRPFGNNSGDDYWIPNHDKAFNDLPDGTTFSTVCPSTDP